ncbi:MAG: hypothetical protein R3F62_21860 [Planctomycetota bacterium]
MSLLVLRHAQELRRAQDPAATLRSLAISLSDLLRQVWDRTGRTVVFRYRLEIAELTPDVGEEILLRSLPGRVKEDLVTAGEQLRAQGELRGMRRSLLLLLETAFSPLPADVERRVACASEAELLAWIARVPGADHLDEVLTAQ